jgi:hypothetical protein
LIEDCYSDDDDGDGDDDDDDDDVDDDDRRGSGAEDRLGSIGESHRPAGGGVDRDGANHPSTATGDVDGGDRSVDTGPDFAAGVTTKPSTADALAPNSTAVGSSTESPPRGSGSNSSPARCGSSENLGPRTPQALDPPRGGNHRRATKGKKKQRVSSGVWCAGQLEIEDCRGTIHPDENEFREESHADVAIRVTTSTASEDGNDSARGDSTRGATSLNRTTWDMLDGKWLGL